MSSTILVLEDDSVLQNLLCEVLRDEGFEVVAADTLPDLLQVAPPTAHLLITDLLVDQEVVGLDAIEQIRHVTHAELPALICSGAQQHMEALQPEIDRLRSSWLAKPFTIDDLVQAVGDALNPNFNRQVARPLPAWCA